MKKSLVLPLSAAFVAAGTCCSIANPLGGAVQTGSATITHSGPGSVTINQSSDKVIIDWSSFSIAAGELTRFVQPGANSAALNRVLGGNPTSIYGMLEGNGRVYVINPAGILVGPSGVINTHSFAGSTLDVNDASFLSGVGMRFAGDSTASIRNEGTIRALGGDVFLFAHKVENAGSLNAANGTVGLGAGSEIVLSQAGTEHVKVLAGNVNVPQTDVGVNNAGAVQAASAELKAAGGNIYALAINNGGIVRATTVVNEGGHIYLRAAGGNIQNSGTLAASGVAGNGGSIVLDGGHNATAPATVINSGTIEARGDAAGSKGGAVDLLGDHVGLFGKAVVDVSGQAGGGTALIGGDFHGSNLGVQNSEITYVAPGAQIRADALTLGNGGNVAVWSDDSTRFYGEISVRGGNLGGNGGFAETSSKGGLEIFGATVKGGAMHGLAGTWLLDPTTINVVASDPGDGSFTSLLSDVDAFATADKGAGLTSIDVSSIDSASTQVTLEANGVINFLAPISMNNLGIGITARSGGNINIFANDSITTKGGSVILLANDPTATSPTGIGSITMLAPISTAGGGQANGSITLQLGSGSTGTINFNDPSATLTTGGGTGNIDIKSPAVLGASVTFDSGGGNITLESSLDGANSLTLSAHAGSVSLASVGATTPLTGLAASGSTLTLNGAVKIDPAGTVDLESVGDITINAGITAGSLQVHSGISGSGNISFGGTSVAIDADSQSYQAGDGPGGAGATAHADLIGNSPLFQNTLGSGVPSSFTYRQDAAIGSAAVPPIAPGSYTIQSDDGAVSLPALTLPGNLQVTANGGSITENGALIVNQAGKTATFSVSAANSSIVLDTQANDLSAAVANFGAGGGVQDFTLRNISASATVPTLPVGLHNLTLQFNNAAITLPAITLTGGGNLSLKAGGDITDSGNVVVPGTTTLDATTGNRISLTKADDFVGPVSIVAANDVLLNDVNGLVLGPSTVSGNLAVTAGGAITQSGAIVANGAGKTASFSAAGNSITLGNANNDFTTAKFTGSDVTVNDANALDLGASTVSGNLTVTAGGAISQSGTILANGAGKTASFSAAGNTITLGNVNNDFTTAKFTGSDVTVEDANALDVGASTVTGNLTVTAGAAITQSGTVLANGAGKTASFSAAGNSITLGNANNDFTTAKFIGSDVTVNDVNKLDLGASTVTGNLTVTAAGAISQSGVIVANGVGKTATFTAAGNSITLGNPNNDFSTVKLTGADVTVNDVNGLDLGASSVSGNLNVTAGGPITQSGTVIANGAGKTASFSAAGNAITLLNANNDFTTAKFTGGTVMVNDVNALDLGASTVTGTLNVTAGGSITESGALTVSQGAAFTVSGLDSSISLETQANDLTAVTVNISGVGTHDLGLRSINVGATIPSLPARLHTLTLQFDKAAINLPAVTLTGGGNLNLTAGGNITDIGNVVVPGTTTLAAGSGNNITLTKADDFGGAVSIVSGKDVTLNDINTLTVGGAVTEDLTTTAVAATTLNALTVGRNLSVTAGGLVSDNGNLAVVGTASLAAGTGNNITFTKADTFGGSVSIVSGKDVTLNDVGALTVGGAVAEDLTTTASGATTLNALNVARNLKVTAGGLISDNGNVVVVGTTSLAAGTGNNITFTKADTFGGAVSIVSGKDVTLNDVGALTLGGAVAEDLTTTASGTTTLNALTVGRNLSVTAGGVISDNGNVAVVGTTSLAAGTGNNITLSKADTFGGVVSIVSAKDVTLDDVGALTVGGAVAEDLTTTASGTTTLNALTVGRNLSVTAGGVISDNGNVAVVGTTSLAAGTGNNITLTKADTFGGAVSIASGKDVTLNDVGALTVGGAVAEDLTTTASGATTLNTLNVGRNLSVTAGGLISDSGNVAVVGTTSLAAGTGNNITLTKADTFGGAVSIVSGKDVTLNDVGALTVGGAVAEDLTTTASGATTLNALTVGRNLSVIAGGVISDNGNVAVVGTTSLAAGTGNNITLTKADSFGGAVSIVSGKDVTLNDVGALTVGGAVAEDLTTTAFGATTLNTLNVGRNLSVTTGGLISDSGNVAVVGTTSLAAGTGNNITLTKADTFGGAVGIVSGKDVTLNDVGALTVGGAVAEDLTTTASGATTLNALTVGRNVSVTAGGLISDNGNVVVAGTTSLAAGSGNNITLSKADAFGGAVSIVSGKDVTLNDAGALTVGGAVAEDLTTTAAGATTLNALTVGRNLSVIAGGVISDNGNVVVAGTTSLAAGTGNNITLTKADTFAGAVSIVSAKDVTLNDVGALTVGGAVAEDLTTTASGATSLNALTVGRNLSVTAGGLISDNGNVVVVGTTSLAAGTGNNITLTKADSFGGAVSIVSAKDVTLNDVGALTVGGAVAEDLTTTASGATSLNALTVGRNLSVTAGGLISDNGNVVVVGTTSLAAGTGNNITLTKADDFGGVVSIVSAKDVTLNDINTLTVGGAVAEDLTTTASGATTLNALTVGRNLSVKAGGLVSDNGNVVVAGTTSLAAGTGNNITLTKADAFGGAVSIVSGKDVTLNDVGALTVGGAVAEDLTTTAAGVTTLNALNVGRNLSVTAGGLISDSGNVAVVGTTSLAAGTGNNITLTKADSFGGAVSIVSGKDVTLNDVGALTVGGAVTEDLTTTAVGATTLNALTVGRNMSVTAGGLISDNGNVVVAGTTTLAAGTGNNITLTKADDFGGAVSIVSGKDVTLNDIKTLTLGGAVTEDLTTTAAGATTLNTLTVGRNMSVTAGGLISDNGNVVVAGTTSLAAGTGNNITLTKADDFGGAVSIVSGKDVTLNDINTLTVGGAVAEDLTTTAAGATTLNTLTVGRNMSVTAGGLISDNGNVVVSGTTILAAGAGNNITLTKADDFGGVVSIVSGKDVTLNDINTLTVGGAVAEDLTTTAAGATTLNALTVGRNMSVTAGGLISDQGNIVVAGTTTLAAGTGNNITLTKADDFGGAVSIVSGNDVTLNDINTLTVGGAVAEDLTTTAAGATTLNALTVGRNMSVTAGGLISDNGNVVVAGTTSLAAGTGNNITLTKADDFGGEVSIVSGNDVTLNDINTLTVGGAVAEDLTTTAAGATTLNALTVGRSMSVTAGGLISDNGNIVVAGTTTLAAGTGNNITLTKADSFGGAVSIVSGKDVTLNDVGALTVGGAVAEDLTTMAAGATTLNTLTVGRNMSVTAGGLISDNGNVVVAGTTSLAAGTGNNITLTKADDFGGAVSIVSGKDVTLNDVGALTVGGAVTEDLTTTAVGATTLNALTVGRNMSVTAGGLISDNGNVVVAGTTSLAAGTGNNITLTKADDFGGAVSIVSGKDVTLNDVNTLTVGGAVAEDLTTTAAGATTLNALTVGRNMSVTAGGLISDNGNVVVAGTTSLAAGTGNNITLTKADDFGGAVSIVSGKDVTLNDINTLTVGGAVAEDLTTTAAGATTLNALTVGRNMSVTAGGLISDNGNVVVAGTTILAAGTGNNITLTKADDFGGAVSIVSGKDVTLNDINTLTVGGAVAEDLTTTAAGATTLNALTVGRNMSVTAGGLISDNDNVVVAGTTSLAAGTGNNITLTKADDFGGAVSIVSGKDVTLNDINTLTVGGAVAEDLTTTAVGATTLNALTVGRNMSVTAGGLISDNGNVVVAGTTTLGAGTGNNITLTKADDFGGAVSIVSGKDVTLNDINTLTVGGAVAEDLTTTAAGATTLNALTVGRNMSVTAGGLISDNGNVVVAGTTTLGAGIGNNITLTKADDFGGAVSIVSGKDVTLNDINTLTVGGAVAEDLTTTAAGATTLNALAVGRNMSVTAGGLISDNGNVVVAGTTTLGAGTANNITLTKADDFGGAVSIVSGKDVTLNDINTLTVGGAVAEDLTTTAAGGTTLNALTVGRNMSVTAGGLISDNGNVVVAGTTTLAAGTGNNITLTKADDFGGVVSIVSGKDVTLNDIKTLTVGGAVAEDLTTTAVGATTLNALTVGRNMSVTAGGLISDNGNVVVAGTTTLGAGNGNNITLTKADDFGGAVSIVSGKDVTLNDIKTLTVGGAVAEDLTTTAVGATTLNALTVGRNISVTAGGLISDNGNVVVAGTTSLAAGTGNNITLTKADDFGGVVSIVSGKDVTLNDIKTLTVGGAVAQDLTTTSAGATTLNTVNVGGNLSVTAGGTITQSGTVLANGTGKTANFTAPGQSITLADPNNDFTTAEFTGASVTVNDINTLDLGQSTVTGNLTVTAPGGISQTDPNSFIRSGGLATFTAGPGTDVLLGNLNNNFAIVSVPSGRNVTLTDSDGFRLSTVKAEGTLSLNTTTKGGDITEVLDGTVSAKILTGSVKGKLILGDATGADLNPASGNKSYVSPGQPLNDFASLGDISHNGELYIFDSSHVAYGTGIKTVDGVAVGEIVNPMSANANAQLGLKITGSISGQGLTVIRTAGDLVMLGNAQVTTSIQPGGAGNAGDIELSAESYANPTGAGNSAAAPVAPTTFGNFHNLRGVWAADGSAYQGTAPGKDAVVAGSGSRFLVFSTDAKQNSGEQFIGGTVTFNGLGTFNQANGNLGFIADHYTSGFANLASLPLISQNNQPDNGGNAFVFVQKQAILQSDEAAKFFFDVFNVGAVQAVGATANLGDLPPENPPTIWTSSYHLYIEDKKKRSLTNDVKSATGFSANKVALKDVNGFAASSLSPLSALSLNTVACDNEQVLSVTAADVAEELDQLSPERPAAIWTSCYPLYLEVKQNKSLAEHPAPVLAVNLSED